MLFRSLHNEELGQAYASADLFVFPSTTDTYGNVVVEAMASGLPVVVSDQGGPGELLRDPRDGHKVTTGDVGKWVSTILRVAGNVNNTEIRQARRERTISAGVGTMHFKVFGRMHFCEQLHGQMN